MRPTEALATVDMRLTELGFNSLDDRNDVDNRNHAVSASLDVSLRLLNEAEQRHFSELVVFPGGVNVPVAALREDVGNVARGDTELMQPTG